MTQKNNDSENLKKQKEQLLNEARKVWSKLHDFKAGYTMDMLIEDLTAYFGGEVDFDFEKIRDTLSRGNKLNELVERAILHNTHPVSEFVKEMLIDSSEE